MGEHFTNWEIVLHNEKSKSFGRLAESFIRMTETDMADSRNTATIYIHTLTHYASM